MTRAVLDSIEELLADADERTPLESAGKSGADMERVVIGGERFVLKRFDLETDWILRASGVPGGATLEVWRRGILDALPGPLVHPIVAAAHDRVRPSVSAVLMHDVSDLLVPVSDEPITLAQQDVFLDHMAALHAAFWDSGPDVEVVTLENRYLELSPRTAAVEVGRGSDHLVPRLIGEGWPLLREVAPRAARVVVPLAHDPAPLVRALASTPQTFVHGDWKLDNLGTDEEGRTVLLDWEMPGRAPAACDLGWYLAINCRRLPTSKEQAIETYRASLERHGVDTGPWWERQLGLCLLGALVQFGWEKALGGRDDELVWWEEQAVRGAGLL
jgi:hypothetical protein